MQVEGACELERPARGAGNRPRSALPRPFSLAFGEAFLLERLPREWHEERIHEALADGGRPLEDWRQRIFLMRSRLGRSMGRALVLDPTDVPEVLQAGLIIGLQVDTLS